MDTDRTPTTMYEAVRVMEEGPTTPARFASAAARLGFDGIVYLGQDGFDVDHRDAIRMTYGIDVACGIEVTATTRAETSQVIAQARPEVDVLCVDAATTDLQRFVAEQSLVDVLCWSPASGEPVSHTVARSAADHGVYLCFDLGPILRTSGDRRVRAIRALHRTETVVEHYDIPVVISATPSTHFELRSPREIRAVAQISGLSGERIDRGLANWRSILERTRRARSDTFIEPGARLIDDEADDR